MSARGAHGVHVLWFLALFCLTPACGKTTKNQVSDTGAAGAGASPPHSIVVEPCSSFPETYCGWENYHAVPKTVNVLILFDRSYSMLLRDNYGRLKQSEALLGFDAFFERDLKDVNVGLLLYPFDDGSRSDGACSEGCCSGLANDYLDVPVQAFDEAREPVLAALEAAPYGPTPAVQALNHARSYFTVGAGASLRGDKLILLVSDGGATCSPVRDCAATCPDPYCERDFESPCVDDGAVVDRLDLLRDAGIDTLVVGTPASSEHELLLDLFARAGGRTSSEWPSFRDPEDLATLSLDNAIVETPPCHVEPTSAQTFPVPPDVYIDCQEVPWLSEGAAGQGTEVAQWEWAYDEVLFLGETCERIIGGVERIDLLFECPLGG